MEATVPFSSASPAFQVGSGMPHGNLEIFEGSHQLGEIAEAIAQVKNESKEFCLNNSRVRYLGSCYIDGDLGQIFGDIGNVIFSALSIAQICKPALSASASFAWTSCILGSLGGVLNIGVGLYCLKDANQKYTNLSQNLESKKYIEENGILLSLIHSQTGDAPLDVQKYCRMLCDGTCMIGIGAIMSVISLSTEIPALGALGAFLAVNPWILPLVWFLITIPLLIEVARANKMIWDGADLPPTMQLEQLKKALENSDDFAQTLQNWFNEDSSETNPLKKRPHFGEDNIDFESNLAQMLETNIGVEAAIEAMHLRALLLKGASAEEIRLQVEKLEAQIAAWNTSQRCRLVQQSLLITSFAFSILGLVPRIPEKAAGVATNSVILLGNFLPLLMDIAWPFTRNCPMTIGIANRELVQGKISSWATSAP